MINWVYLVVLPNNTAHWNLIRPIHCFEYTPKLIFLAISIVLRMKFSRFTSYFLCLRHGNCQ